LIAFVIAHFDFKKKHLFSHSQGIQMSFPTPGRKTTMLFIKFITLGVKMIICGPDQKNSPEDGSSIAHC
jgi:hypothetical protein